MDFEISKAQRKILEIVEKACMSIRDYEEECYLDQRFNDKLIPTFRKYNLLGMPVLKKYHGLGLDILTYMLALERITQEGLSLKTFFAVHSSLGQLLIQQWGSESQKNILKETVKGKKIMAFALTEPEAGSDPASLRTTFEQKGNNYILNGTKMWISNASIADVVLTFARDKRTGKISAFIVERDFEGFGSEEIRHKMGLHTSSTGNIYFKNCVVPRENLLGPKNHGLSVAFSGLMNGRLGVAIGCVGVMEDCLKESVSYSKQRVQFAKPLGKNQLIQRHLALMKERLEASKWISYHSAYLKSKLDRGEGKLEEADAAIATAKHFSSNSCLDVTNSAVQIFGGKGYLLHFRVARHFVDSRVTMIYEGANEILEQKIALSMLGKEFSEFK